MPQSKIGIQLDIDNVNSIGKNTFNKIQQLLFKHKVVIFKRQQLTDKDLLRFSIQFGPVFNSKNTEVLGSKSNINNGIVIVGNNAPEYKEAFLGYQEVLPHSDHQWVVKPSSISILYAIDVNNDSAPTKWTDTSAIYSSLPETLKREIINKKIITFNPFYRPFGEVNAKYVNRKKDLPPGEQVSHPLVRTHPHTKEKILYMHRAYEMEFENEPFESGYTLWNILNGYIDKSKDIYEHNWENGDLVIWDNRATIHYREKFDSSIRRVLKRVSIAGEKPF